MSEPESSVYKNMVRGSAWAVAMRWGLRSIGFVNVIILARVLTPKDFGILAMAVLVIGFMRGFTELGAQTLLIREQNADRDHCDTAWTIKLLQGLFIAGALVVLAPLAASYFDEERVRGVMYALAFVAILDGTRNIGLVLARKELDFATDFKFHVYARLLSFFITLPLALVLRSYWALVLGKIAASALSVPLSFWMHPYRPRLSLAKAREYLTFGSSIVPARIGRFLNNKFDVFVVGGAAGTSQLGSYNVASDLAGMLTGEVLEPIGRGLMPNYATLAHDPRRLATTFANVLGAVAAITLPFGFGLWAVSADVVPVLLGPQWIPAIPLLQALSIRRTVMALTNMMTSPILVVAGHERRMAMLIWLRLLVLVPIVVVAARLWDVVGVARSTIVAALIVFPVVVFTLLKSLPLSGREVLGALGKPLVAASAMAAIVQWVAVELPRGAITSLALEVGVGAVVYVAAVWLLWELSGRPRGFESQVAAIVAAKLSRKKG